MRVMVIHFPTGRMGRSGAGHSSSWTVTFGDVIARVKKAPPETGVSTSRHEYFVRMVTARSGYGDPVCRILAMSFRGSSGEGSLTKIVCGWLVLRLRASSTFWSLSEAMMDEFVSSTVGV